MKVKFTLTGKAIFYHKKTMKELVVDKTVSQCYDEYSEEYKQLCDEYAPKVGMIRELDNKDAFDEKLMRVLSEEAKKEFEERNEIIVNVFHKVFKDEVTGYVDYFGTLIAPQDFCAVEFGEYNISITKA